MDKPTNEEAFDLENVYDEQIAPLMTKIIAICTEHKLPMFATFLYMNDPEAEESSACTTHLLHTERPIPDQLWELVDIMFPKRPPALNIKVTKADGSVEVTRMI